MKLSTKLQNNYESSKLLKFFFEQKRKHQPNYSLRALSRDLKLSQSYVSEIFSGKKMPSAQKIQGITQALGMDALAKNQYEETFFKDLFPSEESKKWVEKKWNPVTAGDGSILKKWYFLVILDLIDCRGFVNDNQWIAKRIGIHAEEAALALQWLGVNKFIHEKNGRLRRTHKKIRFNTAKSLPDIRSYHRQMMELAAQELNKSDRLSFERRLITGITFSCDPKKLELAKKRLTEAMYSIAEELMTGDPTEVYQINFQLFSHTTPCRSKG